MLIGDKYKIGSDRFNIILFEKYQKETEEEEEDTGEEVKDNWKPLGYFSSIQNTLHYLVDHEIRHTGLEDLRALDSKIGELYLLIMSLNLPTKDSLAPDKGVEEVNQVESIQS